MHYDIKILDKNFEFVSIIEDVSDDQRMAICKSVMSLGGNIKVSERSLTKAAPDAAKSRRQNVVCPECETLFAVEVSISAAQVS